MKKSIIPPNVIFYLGLVSFALGISSITIPEFTIETIIIIIGIVIALGGIITFILRLRNKSDKMFLQVLQLVGSGLNVVLGAVLALIPDVFVEIFIIIFGATIILGGIAQLVMTLSFTPISNTGKMFIGLALVMLIAGTILIINPFESDEIVTKYFGIVICVYGLTNIMMSFWLRNEISNLKKSGAPAINDFPDNNDNDGGDSGNSDDGGEG